MGMVVGRFRGLDGGSGSWARLGRGGLQSSRRWRWLSLLELGKKGATGEGQGEGERVAAMRAVGIGRRRGGARKEKF